MPLALAGALALGEGVPVLALLWLAWLLLPGVGVEAREAEGGADQLRLRAGLPEAEAHQLPSSAAEAEACVLLLAVRRGLALAETLREAQAVREGDWVRLGEAEALPEDRGEAEGLPEARGEAEGLPEWEGVWEVRVEDTAVGL